jgi:hypothetical protein
MLQQIKTFIRDQLGLPPTAMLVGCELEFKRLLAADTNRGSRNCIGNCSGEQCFDQCWPASGQVLSLRVLGEHGPCCNTL